MEPWDPTPRWLRWTQHPNVLFLFSALLLLDLFVLLSASAGPTCRRPFSFSVDVYDVDGALEATTDWDKPSSSHDESSWIGLARFVAILPEWGEPFVWIEARGSWASVTLSPTTAITEQAVLNAATSHLNSPKYAPITAALAPGKPPTHRVRWGAVGFCLGSVSLLALLCFGFITRFQRALRLDRLNQGRCPVCLYAIDGLPAARCPECGTDLPNPEHAPTE